MFCLLLGGCRGDDPQAALEQFKPIVGDLGAEVAEVAV